MKQMWRDGFVRVGAALLGADALIYAGRLLTHKAFYENHSDLMVIGAEIGFLLSIAVVVLFLIGTHRGFTIPIVIGSLLMLYLWFSDIAWWVMAK